MKKIIIFVLPILLLLGFKTSFINKSTQECIVGTWVSKEDSKFKRVFNLSGKSFSYYDGELLDTYNYEITEEVSSNGKIILEFLKLIDVLDNTDTYEFEINAIDDDILVLEFLDGVRSLQSYTKEK